MTMIVDQFYIPQNNDTLASRIMRTKQLIFDNFLNIRCPRDKTDFTSRRAKCCLNVTKAKLRLPSSFPISTSITGGEVQELLLRSLAWEMFGEKCPMFDHPLSHPGTLPEALKGKQVAKVGKDGDLPLILKLSKNPFAILQGGEIFVCQIGLKIHIMKLEINMPLKQ